MRCVWTKAWREAQQLPWQEEFHELRPPVDGRLRGTSSLLNYLTRRDRARPAGWHGN